MISVPHPFTEEEAQKWISGHAEAMAQGNAVHFAIQLKNTGPLIGSIELRSIHREHCHAELSCWIGVAWWGQAFATEASSAMVRHGFERLGLNRIQAFHMLRNPTSGRVLEKIGLKREGVLHQCVRKWGQFEDVSLMAVLRADWAAKDHPGQTSSSHEGT